jgi:hypothetical protein
MIIIFMLAAWMPKKGGFLMAEITGKKIISGTLSSVPEAELVTQMMDPLLPDIETPEESEQEASPPTKQEQDSDQA